MGRPPLHGRAKLADDLQIRVLRAEKTAWKAAARLAGKSFSVWVRETLNKAASP